MKTINLFRGKYRFLSNFYYAPFELDGYIWPTVEHYYQAYKTEDLNEREKIRHLDTAGEAKKAGKNLDIRQDWDTIKITVMSQAVFQKFHQNPYLIVLLKKTGQATLIEGNTWNDTFWGQCNGVGENHLGRILMTLRNIV